MQKNSVMENTSRFEEIKQFNEIGQEFLFILIEKYTILIK